MRYARKTLSLITLLSVTLLVGRASYGTEYRSGGDNCSPNSGSSTNWGLQFGEISNTDTVNALGIECGVSAVTTTDASAISNAKAFYHDGALTGANGVLCYMTGMNETGSYWMSSVKYSCSTAGGCVSWESGWKGDGYFSWTNPLSGPTSALASLEFTCTLAKYSGELSTLTGTSITY